jgi:predicted GNAT family acetyltransferase
MENDLNIIDNPATGAFETTIDGFRAFADYRIADGKMILPHTVVPPALGGRGIAGKLVEAALARARAEGLIVVPACSYVAAYMQRHPEMQDLLAG